jgi:hypothetical protein
MDFKSRQHPLSFDSLLQFIKSFSSHHVITISFRIESSNQTEALYSLSRGISTFINQQCCCVSWFVLTLGNASSFQLKRLERQSFHLLTEDRPLFFKPTMSLIGSEVEVSSGMMSHDSGDELRVHNDMDSSVDHHPTLSPPRPAERLFLADVSTQAVSAAVLAEQIHLASALRRGNMSVHTDASGWVTAVGESEDDSLLFDASPTLHPISTLSSDTAKTFFPETDDEDSAYERLFKKDILSRKIRDLPDFDEKTYLDSDMATPSTSSSSSSTKFFPAEVPQHVDAAEKVYDTVKGVWMWGKGVTVFKPFLGVSEAIAGKVASLLGSDLVSVDDAVVHKLHAIDDSMLNPAIAAILGLLLSAAGKTEDALTPLVLSILKPLGLIKETAENPEITPVPGVTVQ